MKIRKTTAWAGAAILAAGAMAMGAPVAAADAVDGDVLIQAQDSPADPDPSEDPKPDPSEDPKPDPSEDPKPDPSEDPKPDPSEKPDASEKPDPSEKPKPSEKPDPSKDKDKPKDKTPASKARPVEPKQKPKQGDRGVPARTGDNDAAWAAAGGVVLISVAGGVYALRRRQA